MALSATNTPLHAQPTVVLDEGFTQGVVRDRLVDSLLVEVVEHALKLRDDQRVAEEVQILIVSVATGDILEDVLDLGLDLGAHVRIVENRRVRKDKLLTNVAVSHGRGLHPVTIRPLQSKLRTLVIAGPHRDTIEHDAIDLT